MKKKILALLAVIALVSCVRSTPNQPTNLEGVAYITGEYGTSKINIYRYEFKGHMYQYHHRNANATSGGPVHDPDCPCLKKTQ